LSSSIRGVVSSTSAGADGDRQEPVEDRCPLLAELVGGEVGLEEQRIPLGRPHPRVDLEQVGAERAVVAVLGAAEVGDLRVGAAVLDDLELVVAERVDRADQLGAVAVEHGAVRRPDLDAAYVAHEQAVEHGAVEPVDGRRIAGDQAIRDRRLRDRAAEHLGQRARVGDGLLVGGLPAEGSGHDDDHHERDESRGQELRHGIPQPTHGVSTSGTSEVSS
jgi:hypothetical protein